MAMKYQKGTVYLTGKRTKILVRPVSGLQKGPGRKGGTKAAERSHLSQGKHAEVEGGTNAARNHSEGDPRGRSDSDASPR